MENTKTCKKCGEIKNFSDFGKYNRSKDGLRYECKICRSAELAQYYSKKADEVKARTKDYYFNNLEKCKKTRFEYYQSNKQEFIDRSKKWKSNNLDAVNFHTQTRRANQKQRTPAWANLEKIKEIYKECARITKKTGIVHHVDHIVPLQGKIVSGLHYEGNLQIITAEQNFVKNNHWSI